MSFTETAALLGNLGEFFGSIAVLATLLYLVIQIRGSRAEAEAGIFTANQSNQVSVEAELLKHAELWVAADSGAELSDAEAFRIDRLIRLRSSAGFFGYRRTMALRTGRQKIHAVNLAIFLCQHPGAFKRWLAIQEQERRARIAAGWTADVGFEQAVVDAANAMAPVFEPD